MFVAVSAIGLMFGAALGIKALLADEYILAEFDCGRGRFITIYADTFCDQAEIPAYEVSDSGTIIVPKHVTHLYYTCARVLTAKDLRLIKREDGNLVAIVEVATGSIGLIHDFASGKSFPYDEHLKDELTARLGSY